MELKTKHPFDLKFLIFYSHQSNTQYWKNADKQTLINEIGGMRRMIAKYAQIDIKDVTGFRAPFLQTTGNITFQV